VGEWFRESGELRHRMAVTEPWIPAYYAGPDFESRLVAMADIPGDSPQELAQGCRKLGISYVVFDSDNGFMRPGEFYYTWYHVGLLRDLRFGRSTPDFTLVATLRNGFSYAHIYRLNGVETP